MNIQQTIRRLGLPFKLDNITEGDGNCFSRAVVQQCQRAVFQEELEREKRYTGEYTTLKKKVVEFATGFKINLVIEMKKRYESWQEEEKEERKRKGETTESWDKYWKRMRMDKEWADAKFVQVTAWYLNRDIYMIPETATEKTPWMTISGNWQSPELPCSGVPLLLGYNNGLHYQSLLPTEESKGRPQAQQWCSLDEIVRAAIREAVRITEMNMEAGGSEIEAAGGKVEAAGNEEKVASGKEASKLLPQTSLICRLCGMVYHDNLWLMKHMKLLHNYRCTRCPMRFTLAKRFKAHLSEVHFQQDVEELQVYQSKSESESDSESESESRSESRARSRSRSSARPSSTSRAAGLVEAAAAWSPREVEERQAELVLAAGLVLAADARTEDRYARLAAIKLVVRLAPLVPVSDLEATVMHPTLTAIGMFMEDVSDHLDSSGWDRKVVGHMMELERQLLETALALVTLGGKQQVQGVGKGPSIPRLLPDILTIAFATVCQVPAGFAKEGDLVRHAAEALRAAFLRGEWGRRSTSGSKRGQRRSRSGARSRSRSGARSRSRGSSRSKSRSRDS